MRVRAALRLCLSVLAILAGGSCAADSPYFGNVEVPATPRLVFENHGEPETLDPSVSILTSEWTTLAALHEGLVTNHPFTLEPMAGIATHYEVNATGDAYTFYLRGHPQPRGTRLATTDDLRRDFERGTIPEDLSRGLPAPAAHIPARWSDGRTVRAEDFVYSWRRVVNPATASANAVYAFTLRHAEEINKGELPLDQLGVRAVDDFTLTVSLRAPTPFFLKTLWQPFFAPQRVDIVEPGGTFDRSWTAAGKYVSNGPFLLADWRPYEKMVLRRNPNYYEEGLVALDEIEMLPVPDGASYMNLYKSGQAHLQDGINIPKFFLNAVRTRRDFHTLASYYTVSYAVNVTRPPLNNVHVRYALNMATDKEAISKLLGTEPALAFVPDDGAYKHPASVFVEIEGRRFDVLKFDPEGARAMLRFAGYPDGKTSDGRPLRIDVNYVPSPMEKVPEVLQQQWREILGVDARPQLKENKVAYESQVSLTYDGLMEGGWFGTYLDPDSFLLRFPTGSTYNGTGWTDPVYDRMLAEANRITDPTERMRRLSETEAYMLRAMPVIPILHDTLNYLQKPFVRGFYHSRLGMPSCFKYTWIDLDWRPPGG